MQYQNHIPPEAGTRLFDPSEVRRSFFDGVPYEVGVANPDDIRGILVVQEPNLPEYGGKLSVRMSYERIRSMMDMMPVIVARQNGVVVGYLISSPLSLYADVPVINAMVDVYQGTDDAYVYGPICVAKAHRRHGVAEHMFDVLRANLPDREGFTFVRKDNETSMAAHRHMGLNEVGTFQFNGADHAIFAYMG